MKKPLFHMTFRKKIFFSQLLLFLIFLIVFFPFVEKTVKEIVHKSLEETTDHLVKEFKECESEQQMISLLEKPEYLGFFRVSLLNEKGELIYDSQLSRLLGERFIPFYPTDHPEVLQAIKKGFGYFEGYSRIFSGKFAYVAVAFNFKDTKYILRTSFPYAQVEDLVENFNLGFIIFFFFLLLFFSLMTWLIFYRLSRPIQQIIQAVASYQEGKQDQIPEISLKTPMSEKDDIGKLAITLNSLSERIRQQIKNLMEERNEKEAILESLGEGVIAVDGELNIRYVNFIGSKMLGIPKRILMGKPFPSIEPSSSPLLKRTRELLQYCQERQAILTDSILLGEGRKIYLDLIAAPKSHRSGAIIVLQDKSSHYKVLEMGKDFVANASHELRTPITIIKGFAETLQDLPEISPEMLADITEKIVRNCERMDNLVRNLLTLADIENLPETRFKETDLIALLENCRHVLISIHPEVTVDLEKEKDEIVAAVDPDLLELALMNLMENAVKYSKPPAYINIKIHERKEEVEISISDRGIGIPKEDLEHIFERFYTVDKTHSRRLGGAGLGLSIVKTIVEKHDGTIAVDSALGQGTTFTIVLPLNRFIG